MPAARANLFAGEVVVLRLAGPQQPLGMRVDPAFIKRSDFRIEFGNIRIEIEEALARHIGSCGWVKLTVRHHGRWSWPRARS